MIITSCKDSLCTPIESLEVDQKLQDNQSIPTSNSHICLDPECIHAASRMLEYMDKTVEPCENFYDFACGDFLKNTIIPDGENWVDDHQYLQTKIDQQMKIALEETSEPGELKPITMAKKLYQNCMNMTAIEEAGLNKTFEILKKLGGWPVLTEKWDEEAFDWVELLSNSSKLGYPIPGFFTWKIAPDFKNMSEKMIYIDKPEGIGFKMITKPEPFFKYMVDIAVLFGANKTRAEEDLVKSLELEFELSAMTLASGFSLFESPGLNLMTLKDLEGNYSSIPWRKYFNLNLEPHTEVGEDEKFIVTYPLFFRKLETLLQKTEKRAQANYLIWKAVGATARYLTEEIREWHREYSKFSNKRTEVIPRWKECLDLTSSKLDYVTSALYVRKYFKHQTKESVVRIIQDIQQKFIEILQKNDWIDNDTSRMNLVTKVKAIINNVAHPDEFLVDEKLSKMYGELEITTGDFLQSILNVSIAMRNYTHSEFRKPSNRSEWMQNVNQNSVNAAYNVLNNNINIPAGILQGVFFNEKRPKYINFATIGFIIGHEITHGFDYIGSLYDGEGNNSDLLDQKTRNKLFFKSSCFTYQYKNYTDNETGKKLNGLATEREDMADNGGIKIAYLAYQNYVKKNGTEPTLPGLEYSPSQLFWISAAQPYCRKISRQVLKAQISRDNHSPQRFRILVPFSNMPEFLTDFNCPSGSKMNPELKCSVW